MNIRIKKHANGVLFILYNLVVAKVIYLKASLLKMINIM